MFKKNFDKAFVLAVLWASLCSLVACSDKSDDVAGGVTDIGNSVAGIVVTQSGAPAAHARVVAYYDSWDHVAIEDSVETVTDEQGAFTLAVDSGRGVVLFAETEGRSGLYRADTGENRLAVAEPRRLESSLARAGSGYMRIVGGHETAQVQEDGSFAFETLPVGEIALVYVENEAPHARFEFETSVDETYDTLKIPALEERENNEGWLTVTDYRYYCDGYFGGIHVTVPAEVDVPQEDPEDTAAVDTPVVEPVGPIAVWLRMDGDAVVYDNDSTLADSVDYVEGLYGSGVKLRPGQFIDLDTLDPCAGDFTLSLWTKWEGPNGHHQILFSQRSYWSDSTSRFQWHFEGNYQRFLVLKSMPDVAEGISFGDSSLVPIGEWTMLTLVSRAHKLSMYVNGEVVSFMHDGEMVTAAEFIPNDLKQAVPFRVGGNEIDDETWNGVIDEVFVENVARPDEWIRKQYLGMVH